MWNTWIFGQGNVDLSIVDFRNGKLDIGNKGSLPVPVVVNVNYKDNTTWKKDFSAVVWEITGKYDNRYSKS